jgi:hypothetical protein
VRVIRNAFAHSAQPIKFGLPEVAEICMSLHTPNTGTLVTQIGDTTTPRGCYVTTTVLIAERLKLAIKTLAIPKPFARKTYDRLLR